MVVWHKSKSFSHCVSVRFSIQWVVKRIFFEYIDLDIANRLRKKPSLLGLNVMSIAAVFSQSPVTLLIMLQVDLIIVI